MEFAQDTRVIASRQQISCDLSGEAVILNLDTGAYYGLNPVGARIWQFLYEPRTVSEICRLILADYDVDVDLCERDVRNLLTTFLEAGLIEADASP